MTWKVQAANESTFQLQNHFTSKTFAAVAKSEGDEPVTQVPLPKQGGEALGWQITKLPDGTYKIGEAKSGKALTAVRQEGDSSVRVFLKTWQDKDEQKWELLAIDPKSLTM